MIVVGIATIVTTFYVHSFEELIYGLVNEAIVAIGIAIITSAIVILVILSAWDEFPRIVLIGNWRRMTPLEAKSYLDARVSEEEFLFAEEDGDEFEFWSGVFEWVTLQ